MIEVSSRAKNFNFKLTMETFDVNEVFNKYTKVDNLTQANIFHLYDTGKCCVEDNSGYHDSRHFNLIVFNTVTMEKRDLGRHDGLSSFTNNVSVDLIRVYHDGSFMISLHKPAKLDIFQCVQLS